MNLLRTAASCPNRDLAASAIIASLGIVDDELARALLPEPDDWRRMSEADRLRHLGSWLNAECIELMEASRVVVPIMDSHGAREAVDVRRG